MKEELICPICGEPTNVYMGNARKDKLCRKHGKLANAGEIELCPDCGKWYNANKQCECKKPQNAKPTEKNSDNELTCIICGEPSNGKHFCRSCYFKYKDRAIDIRIIHCAETKMLDEYGNKTYKCDDGRVVRSRAEAIICSWLYNNKIRVKYEETVYYKDEKTGEIKELHPDFYLPDYDLYIEYNELTNAKYLQTKEFTKQIYEKQSKKIVIMTEEELHDVAAFIRPLLIK